ncbi:MAG TPA: hypothetical protein VG942_02025, partial [Hyphomonadaceae bacterium]|nr:hypothetical protein [Hyphomonadaceae bacterium]
QHLVQDGWLAVRPGVGTVVAEPPAARSAERQRLLSHEVEQLVVEAKRVGLDLKDVTAAIERRWKQLSKD